MERQLVLSSSSPARRALLSRLKIPFEYVSPDIDETPLDNETVDDMVLRLAISKAKKSQSKFPHALIIGCDQVGILENKILAKPITHDKAVAQLRKMSGKMVRFKTGLCLFDASNNQYQTNIIITDVYMREITDNEIQFYLQHEDALQCAGSFQAEGLGITLIEKLHGDDYTALIGLPLICLSSMLKNTGMLF